MSTRISHERLDWITAQLTPRDHQIVAALERVRLATGNQLRRSVYERDDETTRRAARRELARLVRWRVVDRLERRSGGPASGSDSWTYGLGVAAQRLSGHDRGRRPHLPGRPMWAHVLAGAEVYSLLAQALRETDRSLVIWQGEPAAWRDFPGAVGERQRLKPDAYVEVAGPGYIDASFIEIDMGTQSPAIVRRKAAAYAAYAAAGQEQARGGVFPRVVFVVPSDARLAVIERLIAGLPASHRPLFAVATMDGAVEQLLGGSS